MDFEFNLDHLNTSDNSEINLDNLNDYSFDLDQIGGANNEEEVENLLPGEELLNTNESRMIIMIRHRKI